MSGITRATPNTAQGAISVYFMVPGTLPDGSSIFTFKTPALDNPIDVRLRTKGVIDVKVAGIDDPVDTSTHLWVKGKWARCDVTWQWDAVSGFMDADIYLYLRGNGEYSDADSILHVGEVTTSPTNYSHGAPNPSDPVMFEVERVWETRVIPGPYGNPPPAPPLNPAMTAVRPGVATNDTIHIAVYTGDRSVSDVIGLNVSTDSGMAGPTLHSLGVHDAAGMNKLVLAGLTPNTRYYHQAVVNGTPVGAICSLKTTQVAGTPCTIKRAVGGCQQSPPASLVAFKDMTGANDAWVAQRIVHLGDDTYPEPSALTDDPISHEISYAQAMCDSWSLFVAAAGLGLNKEISDHDCNNTAGGNASNFNDPTTIASIAAWDIAVPAPMADIRVPKHARYWSEVEGNVRFVYLDGRTIDRTDTRKTGVAPDAVDSVMIDPIQENWLYDEATLAAAAGQMLIVFSDTAFLGVSPFDPPPAGNGIPVTYSDKWASYTVQRDRIDLTLASIMPITTGHPNVEIWSSDSHALQYGVSANGIKCRTCGPFDQNLHAHYQSSYTRTYPANTKGDTQTGGTGNLTAQRQQYMRMDIVESPAGTFTVTAGMRDCSPKVVGDTPVTEFTDVTVYQAGGDDGGGGTPVHLYSLPGVPS